MKRCPNQDLEYRNGIIFIFSVKKSHKLISWLNFNGGIVSFNKITNSCQFSDTKISIKGLSTMLCDMQIMVESPFIDIFVSEN